MPGNFGSNPSAKFYFMMSRGAIKQEKQLSRIEDQIGKWKTNQAMPKKIMGTQPSQPWRQSKRPIRTKDIYGGALAGKLNAPVGTEGIKLNDISKRKCGATFSRFMNCMGNNGFDDYNCQREKLEWRKCHDMVIKEFERIKLKEKAGKLPLVNRGPKNNYSTCMKNMTNINRELKKLQAPLDTEAMWKTRTYLRKMQPNTWTYHVPPSVTFHSHYFKIDHQLNYHPFDVDPKTRRVTQMKQYCANHNINFDKQYNRKETWAHRTKLKTLG